MVEEVTITGSRGRMPMVVAPPAETPAPGVLVISDALGMTTDLRNQSEWLAGEGFLAAAPDLYYWGGRIRCLFDAMRQAIRREGELFDDFERVRAWLAADDRCTGTVGVIGFCLGGGFALLLAPRPGYSASSVNYGTVPKDSQELLAGSCPIVGSYGGRDPTLRGAAAKLEQALAANGVAFDITEYPDAGHAFLNDHVAAEEPVWARVMGRPSRSAYHAASAEDARRRIAAFFHTHLEDPAADAE